MKTGKTLSAMAAELEAQSQLKKDFIVDTRQLTMGDDLRMGFPISEKGDMLFNVRPHAHRQIATHLGIPQKYYDRMQADVPSLLAHNVNGWLRHDPTMRMVRTLGVDMRAFLSNRYRPIDNYDVAEAVLPILGEMEGARIESCEVTDSRMYLKVVNQRLTMEVKKGDPVQAGIVISNSEIGLGAVRIEPMIFRLICLNGAIMPDSSLSKYHTGRAFNGEEGAFEIFRDETLKMDDRAFFMRVVDTVRASIDEVKFKMLVERHQEATTMIEKDPVKAVEVVAKRFTLTDDEKGGVLRHLIAGGDVSKYGLANAITRLSQDVPDYDRATDLERLGGQVIELPKEDWKSISLAQ